MNSMIPQDFRPSRRWNRLRNGEPWRPSDYEEERMRNIARNQEMLRKLRLEPYEGNPSPATKVNFKPLRKSDKIHLQVSRPSPGSYREKRMHNIATNKEMLRISYLKVTRRYSHRCLRPRDERQENRSWGPEDPQNICEVKSPQDRHLRPPGGRLLLSFAAREATLSGHLVVCGALPLRLYNC